MSSLLRTALRQHKKLWSATPAAVQQRLKSDDHHHVAHKANPEAVRIEKLVFERDQRNLKHYPPPSVGTTFDSKQATLADPWDLIVGPQRFQLAMRHKGYVDIYYDDLIRETVDKDGKKIKFGSKENPVIATTLDTHRIISCHCDPDANVFLHVYVDEQVQCECGTHFKCVKRELPDLSDYGIDVSEAYVSHH